MSDIGALVAEARARAGLTQKELAERAGTSQPAVARLESGAAVPTVATLRRLLGAAGFDLRLELAPRGTADAAVDAYKRDVDRSLLQENLRRSVDARLRRLDAANASLAELRSATRAARTRAARSAEAR